MSNSTIWYRLPVHGTRYLVKIKCGDGVEIRTAEFVFGHWCVDGCETSVPVLEFAELPDIE